MASVRVSVWFGDDFNILQLAIVSLLRHTWIRQNWVGPPHSWWFNTPLAWWKSPWKPVLIWNRGPQTRFAISFILSSSSFSYLGDEPSPKRSWSDLGWPMAISPQSKLVTLFGSENQQQKWAPEFWHCCATVELPLAFPGQVAACKSHGTPALVGLSQISRVPGLLPYRRYVIDSKCRSTWRSSHDPTKMWRKTLMPNA